MENFGFLKVDRPGKLDKICKIRVKTKIFPYKRTRTNCGEKVKYPILNKLKINHLGNMTIETRKLDLAFRYFTLVN